VRASRFSEKQNQLGQSKGTKEGTQQGKPDGGQTYSITCGNTITGRKTKTWGQGGRTSCAKQPGLGCGQQDKKKVAAHISGEGENGQGIKKNWKTWYKAGQESQRPGKELIPLYLRGIQVSGNDCPCQGWVGKGGHCLIFGGGHRAARGGGLGGK